MVKTKICFDYHFFILPLNKIQKGIKNGPRIFLPTLVSKRHYRPEVKIHPRPFYGCTRADGFCRGALGMFSISRARSGVCVYIPPKRSNPLSTPLPLHLDLGYPSELTHARGNPLPHVEGISKPPRRQRPFATLCSLFSLFSFLLLKHSYTH